MEIISVPLQLERPRTQRYRDGTSFNYLVVKSPFRTDQYGVHLELADHKGKVYQKIEVYFQPGQQLSDPFEANGREYRLMLVTEGT